MGQFFSSAESGQRNLRVVLFIIILATLPFYCLGFVLWGAAPAGVSSARATSTPTLPPVTRSPTLTFTPSPTIGFGPLFTATSLSPLQPTPRQFFPPGGVNPIAPLPTLSPTPFIVIPTSTPAPTLTPFPSDTPIPQATDTTVPIFPTDTTVPFDNNPPPADGGNADAPPPDSGNTGSGGDAAVDAPVVVDIAPIDADQPPTPTAEVADSAQ